MNKEKKIKELIESYQSTITLLEQTLMDARYSDWKEMEGKFYLVECYPVNGKTYFFVYHIISVEKDKITYHYGDLENKYRATQVINNLFEKGYKSWTEITKKEFEAKLKGFEELR